MAREILYVVLPCYNEEDNIRKLVEKWKNEENQLRKKNIDLSLVLVNDGSIDNTLNIANSLGALYHSIEVLSHTTNLGLGEAVNTGINYVISQNNKGLLCVMDADLTHSPYYVHSMIDKLKEEGLSCVIASRYRRGSKVEGLSLMRKLLSSLARIIYTFTLSIKDVRDYTCGYRLYETKALMDLSKKYNGKIIRERSFACMMELLFKFDKEGFKIGEVPFVLKYQLKGGKSKMRIFKTANRSLMLIGKLKKLVNEGII